MRDFKRLCFLFAGFMALLNFESIQAARRVKTKILKDFSRTSLERISEGEIVVYATIDDGSEVDSVQYRKLEMKGAAGIKAPLDATWRRVTAFDQFGNFLPFVKKVEWNSDKRKLHIIAGIWSFKFDSTSRISELETKADTRKFTWEVIEGDFNGMNGSMECEDATDRVHCVLRGEVEQKEYKPSETLFKMAVETILRGVAGKIQRIVELEQMDTR